MKTLIIYSSFEHLPQFLITEGDFSDLHNKVGNCDDIKESALEKLYILSTVFYEDAKDSEKTFEFPVGQSFDTICVTGFAP